MRPNGQGDLFEDFVRDYGERAFHFAYRLCGSADEAKDLVQDAYCRVLSNWEDYDRSRPLNSWFFTILKRLFLDARRHRDACPTVSLDEKTEGADEPLTYADLLPGEEEPLLERLEREESGDLARRAFDRLSVEQRAVLTLCDVEGLGYEAISEVLGIPLGTVRSRVSRARRDLRRYIYRMGRVSLTPGRAHERP